MTSRLEVILSPSEFTRLEAQDLSQAVCVVFDILRATTSMIAALANGAESIVPVAEIPEALALKKADPAILLAGERHGVRIRAEQTGGVDFDLGNSPREFTRDRVEGRTIAMTTTNGTRALRACARSRVTLASSFLNLDATITWLSERRPPHLILVCSGTFDEPALEDLLAASVVCDALGPLYTDGEVSDSVAITQCVAPLLRHGEVEAMRRARNGRRLLESPEFRDDVLFSARRDSVGLIARLDADGRVRSSSL